MPEAVFIISPKTDYRQDLLPRLADILSKIKGVRVIGQGATNVKVLASSDLAARLTGEVAERCFIEKAKRFQLAG